LSQNDAAVRIGIFGAGAIGGYIGGRLDLAGHDVTLVDPWQVRIDTIRSNGLTVSSTQTEGIAHPKAFHVGDASLIEEPFDVVVIAPKAYDTDWIAQLALRHLSPGGAALVAQNGITDGRVAAIVGATRTFGCVVTLAAAMPDPGSSRRTDAYDVAFRIGAVDPAGADRVATLATLMSDADNAIPTDNLSGERWSKLATNCMLNAVAGITGLGAGELRSDVEVLPVVVQLAAETILVGQAEGVDIEPIMGISVDRFVRAARGDGLEAVGDELRRRSRSTAKHPPSLLQDVMRARRTEVEDINGYVSSLGAELGIPTPLCDGVVRIILDAGIGGLQPDPSRIAELLGMLPQRP
jgi:2-dehydropantoate 2-reductase